MQTPYAVVEVRVYYFYLLLFSILYLPYFSVIFYYLLIVKFYL